MNMQRWINEDKKRKRLRIMHQMMTEDFGTINIVRYYRNKTIEKEKKIYYKKAHNEEICA